MEAWVKWFTFEWKTNPNHTQSRSFVVTHPANRFRKRGLQ